MVLGVLNITMHTEVVILDEIPSVTMEVVKVKFLMNSNMTLTVLNLY